jgi:ADP-heptose:LPS heptosyltransferase
MKEASVIQSTRGPDPRLFRNKTYWMLSLIIEFLAPCLKLSAWILTGKGVTSPQKWKKVLLVGDVHIGDLLYRTCSLPALKSALPGCSIYYLTSPSTAEVLEGNPALTGILPWMTSDSPLDMANHHLKQLREMKFDAVLATNCIRYWPSLVLSLRIRAPNRVAFVHKGFSGLVTHPVPMNNPQPYPAYFRDYVAHLTNSSPDWPLIPRLYPAADDELSADIVWRHCAFDPTQPILACFVTTRQPTAVWPVACFVKALSLLHQQTGAQIALCGAQQDRPLLEHLKRECAGVPSHVLAGTLKIKALSCFLKKCDAVLCTDSGPRHVANAVQRPVFFFRNLWSNAIESGSYLNTEHDLCPPQTEPLPVSRHSSILSTITPEAVCERVAHALRTGAMRHLPSVQHKDSEC